MPPTFPMAQVVDPPALAPRDVATLLTTAAPIAGLDVQRIGGGVAFRTNGTQDLVRLDSSGQVCPGPDEDREPPESTAELVAFGAFEILADEACGTLTSDAAGMRRWAAVRFSAFESAQVADELMVATATGNPSLTHSVTPADPGDPYDSTPVLNADAISPSLALTMVENELARRLHGAVGMIHVTPGILYQLNEGGGLDEEEGDEVPDARRILDDINFRLGPDARTDIHDDLVANAKAAVLPKYDRWTTPSGNIVIADAGYTGDGPDGDPDPGEAFIYGSGLVEVSLGPVKPMGEGSEMLDLAQNDRFEVLTRQALVRFDPSTVFAVKVQGVVEPDEG